MGAKSTCADNYLQIIEPEVFSSQLYNSEKMERQFCGDDRPSVYTAKKNRVSIRFKKTVNFSGTGWLINFMGINSGARIESIS